MARAALLGLTQEVSTGHCCLPPPGLGSNTSQDSHSGLGKISWAPFCCPRHLQQCLEQVEGGSPGGVLALGLGSGCLSIFTCPCPTREGVCAAAGMSGHKLLVWDVRCMLSAGWTQLSSSVTLSHWEVAVWGVVQLMRAMFTEGRELCAAWQQDPALQCCSSASPSQPRAVSVKDES